MSAEWPSSLILHLVCFTLMTGALRGVLCADVRLAGGPETVPNSGRVEMKLPDSEEWVAVCGDGWSFVEGRVVCRELGYPGASTVKASSKFGEGNMMKKLGGFNCSGDETHLPSCSHGNVTSGDCGEGNSAIVTCRGPGFKGCFQRNASSDLFQTSHGLEMMTIEECIKHAKNEESQYAGIWGNKCHYNLKSETELMNRQKTEDACGDMCAGDENQRCGSLSLIAVYDIPGSYCSPPDPALNADVSVRPEPDEFYFGTIINVSCKAGFRLQGAPSVQCVKGEESLARPMWESPVPECQDLASTTQPPAVGTGSGAALTLGIINTVLIVILIGILLVWLYFKMRREPKSQDKPTPVAPDYEDADTQPPNGRTDHPRKSAADVPSPVPATNFLPTYSVVDKKDRDKRASSRSSGIPKTNSAYIPDGEGVGDAAPRYSRAMKDRKSAQYNGEEAGQEEPIFGEIMVSPRRDDQEGWVENEMYEAVENPQSDSQF